MNVIGYRTLVCKARYAVCNALARCKLVKLPCIICGAVKVQGHHEDYRKPLEVKWLCRAHHSLEHAGKPKSYQWLGEDSTVPSGLRSSRQAFAIPCDASAVSQVPRSA